MPVYDWVGWSNYRRLFGLENWDVSVRNLLVFASLYIGVAIALGLGFAILIDQQIRVEGTFRSIFLYPMALSFIVTGTAWKWLLDPGVGLERTIRDLGWESFAFGWIKQSDMAIYCVVIAAVWQTVGLRDGDVSRRPARESTPSRSTQRAWTARAPGRSICTSIIPQLGPVFVSAVVILAHLAIKSYDLVIALTNGGPGRSTWLPSIFMYQYTFTRNEMSVGAASAVMMLAAIGLVVLPYLLQRDAQGEAWLSTGPAGLAARARSCSTRCCCSWRCCSCCRCTSCWPTRSSRWRRSAAAT